MPFPPLFPFFLSVVLLPALLQADITYPYHTLQQKQLLNLRQRSSAAGSGAAGTLPASKRYEGSSDLVDLRYHMGPVLSLPIRLYLIWYGRWTPALQLPIRDFLLSLSDASVAAPSAAQWWSTIALYADQTGANVSLSLSIAAEASDPAASRGYSLSRLSVQHLIADALAASSLPVDHRCGVYLVLTAPEIAMQDFCRAVCGFHYFTFPSLVGHTLPYAWVGHSGAQCPELCAYPFAVPGYMARGGVGAMRPPNGDVGTDGMVSVVAHELAELATNPLVNAWYAGGDPTAPTEIADLCEGIYGTGGGGGYTGQVSKDGQGRSYNINGRGGRRFLVQWVWSPLLKACVGPNAMD
ncbi:protein EXORDIUM-like 5 [Elaeis guineensis]|uniref:Protein EXORDIUM-like 5 n=1 Tax=Elaeis guineensis var. tenera TaxID=51953 RepID=A0A6I9QD91_ELAGV|nr:protein EXORDIUM-like 5 [Elaeis guineensis]